ncbi:alpha/beta hydrolase [Aquimarina gracilis]|uniref:Alpha/beta hydrolase n=1 Tax=Aquimarina gracilis TaxID=874422 RepID=A0ABU6A2D5_9FLAO|nr:lysophospholipase [Aquimarina gracilis]MEB3348246.1 alpha/beta hydrolase [Aquimarina gracilis]
MQHREFFFEHSKQQLFGQYWVPNDCKAMVVLVHGMGEHSSRYADYVIPELLAKHIGVLTYDNFGHGKSNGKRGHCPGYESLLAVVDTMFVKAQALTKGVPLFIYGHSMGGNLVINYVLRNRPEIAGAVLTSPFLRLAFQPPAWKMTMGKLMQKIAPSVTLPSGLDVNAISRIPEEVEKYKNDPLVHDKVSPNFSFPIMEAGEWAIKNAATLDTPVLLLHGTDDQIIDYKGSQEFSENTNQAKLILVDGGYHELHKDLEKDKVIRTITKWILKKL